MNDRTDEIRSTRAPTLGEDQIEVLSRYGHTRETEVGQVLFRAGDPSNHFVVVLEGEVEVVDDFAGEAQTMGYLPIGASSKCRCREPACKQQPLEVFTSKCLSAFGQFPRIPYTGSSVSENTPSRHLGE